MPTVAESVLASAGAGGHELSVRRLFLAFSGHARKTYQYSATKVKGSEGNTLLARDMNEIVTVDCASLADALVELLNTAMGDNTAKSKGVGHGSGFATAAGSRCFDTAVTGNVREPGKDWGFTARCIFSTHFFVKTGTETRWFLDPCMFTSYSKVAEVMSWTLSDGAGCFYRAVKRVNEDPTLVLLGVPPADTAPKPKGFNIGYVVFKASDFNKDALLATRGKALNPQWNESTYNTHRDTALATINRLLRDRAGVNAVWTA